ncbi:MAG TPA: 2-dehydropantoate 2-reductase [Gemmatimonadaceae bacterium]|nr:2-dehydropantoate 2-reductase [Gemmatimonadaceae bacterium]
MRIFVVGAGGAGAYFAARWAEAGRDVTLLARGRQLEAIQRGGVTLRTPDGDTAVPVRVTAEAADAASADIVLFATKTWQLAGAVAPVAPHLRPEAVVLGVHNGVDAADELAAACGRARALGGTLRIISYVESPGVIRHVGIPPTITIGELGGGRTPRVERVREALHVGPKAAVDVSDDIQLEIWKKFLFFAPVSGMGAVTQVPIGVFRANPDSRAMLVAAMREVEAVGRSRGIPFAPDAVDQALAFIDRSPPDGTTSLSRDVGEGRPSEIAALSGAVARMGRAAGIATPAHDFIAAVIAPREGRARAAMA